MKYRKPVVMNLGANGRAASGDETMGCVSGPAAGQLETCGTGGAATWGCNTGAAAGAYTSCTPGSAATGQGDCLSGSAVQYYCEAGTGGGSDWYGCNAGPSFA